LTKDQQTSLYLWFEGDVISGSPRDLINAPICWGRILSEEQQHVDKENAEDDVHA
jgi:hypothetical protein